MTLLAPKPLATLIEDARLATLQRYRNVSPSTAASLSRVAYAAAESLGATQAAISLVDRSRVWFNGAFGFDRCDTARESSFCDAVVRRSEALVVADGLIDPRFSDHELVRAEPGVRSYAGAPLIEAGGYTLGTVAVYSAAPNQFTTAVLGELAGLATLVCEFLDGYGAAATPGVRAVGPPVRRIQGWLGVKAIGNRVNPGFGPVSGLASGAVAERGAGLLVVSVARGSPAAEAGLRPTDILHSIGGQTLTAVPDITAAMAGRATGARVPVRFRRSGLWHECDVEIRAKQRLFRGH